MDNKLPKSTLDLYIKLQPKIREVMGPWQWVDRFYCDGTVWTVIRQIDDFVHCHHEKEAKRNFQADDPALIRIPPPINTFNPGHRDLLGMISGLREILCHANGVRILIERNNPLQ